MREIFSYENVMISVEHLLTKGDSCGEDGIYVSQFREYWDLNSTILLNNVWNNTYQPGAIQEVEILKRNGKKRIISKYNCTDRVFLDVIKRELEKEFDKVFSKYSFAYQANKGTHVAARQAAEFIQQGYLWVAELDIKNFFDNIILEILFSSLVSAGVTVELGNLIHKYLYITVLKDGGEKKKLRGIVQGSPVSPLFSNIYLNELDHILEREYYFCRFSDNINIYCKNKAEADMALNDVAKLLEEKCGLKLNKSKSGVYPSLNRSFLGFEFYKMSDKKDILIRQLKREGRGYYKSWHLSSIQRIDKNYHIINDGIITKKDYTILFENDETKMYLPVETCGMLNIYSNVCFNSNFFKFAKSKYLKISIYDEFDEYVGSFVSANHSLATKTMIKQVSIYIDEVRRMEIAKKIEIASLHNQRENLRYYFKHKRTTQLQVAIEELTNSIKEINESRFISQLLLIEARAKQKYLQAFDSMIDNSEFLFERRTRRPPRNEINALISFGNTFMYRRIATEIYKTALDIRVGFVHAANSRSESLNLDIAEIFKPIIVDRAIFTLIHRGQILKRDHFVCGEAGSVLLNQKGKKIFIHEMENKLYQKITIKDCPLTYDKLICNEIQKVFKFVMMGEKYVPFKYT